MSFSPWNISPQRVRGWGVEGDRKVGREKMIERERERKEETGTFIFTLEVRICTFYKNVFKIYVRFWECSVFKSLMKHVL